MMMLQVLLLLLLLLVMPGAILGATATTDEPCGGAEPAPPAFPAEADFDTTGLLGLDDASELVTLRHLGELPAHRWEQESDCPHTAADLADWHSNETWPDGQVPLPGEDVILPKGKDVLLRHCPDEPFGVVTIPEGSSLVFDNRSIAFGATAIRVRGRLAVGSATCRNNARITITLHGARKDAQSAWHKGVRVSGRGVLDLHGALFWPSWSRLAATAEAGSRVLFLQQRVNWQAGQRIVVTGTEVKDARDWHRNEERTIQSVAIRDSFSRIELDEPLSFSHYGSKGFQAEVGLLSRSLTVQGDASSDAAGGEASEWCSDGTFSSFPCPDAHATGFGGFISISGSAAVGRVSGVELFRMGQTNHEGRHPFQVSQAGDLGARSYIQDSSVHRSFFRCVVLHGSNRVLVRNNVAYDTIGHCMFLANGVEVRNRFEYNLAALIHPIELGRAPRGATERPESIAQSAQLTNPADATASGFFISNAFNSFIGNAVSGGYSGFAFVALPEPVGAHRGLRLPAGARPSQHPALEFDGNSCHSAGWWWEHAACVAIGGVLEHPNPASDALVFHPGRAGHDTHCADGRGGFTPCALILTNTKVFMTNVGVASWGLRGAVNGLEVYDAQQATNLLGAQHVSSLRIECRSGAQPEQPRRAGAAPSAFERRWHEGKYIVARWYGQGQLQLMRNVDVRRCGNLNRNSPVWELETGSNYAAPGFSLATANVRYTDVDSGSVLRASNASATVRRALANLLDVDGSLFGTVGPTIVGSALGTDWWKLDDTCELQDGGWFTCSKSSPRTGNRRGLGSFDMRHSADLHGQFHRGELCAHWPTQCPTLGRATHIGRPLAQGLHLTANPRIAGPTNGHGFLVALEAGSPRQLNFTRLQIDPRDTLMIALPYPKGSAFRISQRASPRCVDDSATCERSFRAADSVAAVREGSGDLYFWDESAGLLHIKLVMQPASGILEDPAGAFRFFGSGETRIPPVAEEGMVVLHADCAPNPDSPGYCAYSYDAAAVESAPCSLQGAPWNYSLAAFDECLKPEGYEGTDQAPTENVDQAPDHVDSLASPSPQQGLLTPVVVLSLLLKSVNIR